MFSNIYYERNNGKYTKITDHHGIKECVVLCEIIKNKEYKFLYIRYYIFTFGYDMKYIHIGDSAKPLDFNPIDDIKIEYKNDQMSDNFISQLEYIFEILEHKYREICNLQTPTLEFRTDYICGYIHDYDLRKFTSKRYIVQLEFDDYFSIKICDIDMQINEEVKGILYIKAVEVSLGLITTELYYRYIGMYLQKIEDIVIDIINAKPVMIKSARAINIC